jgi:hypothetical protein
MFFESAVAYFSIILYHFFISLQRGDSHFIRASLLHPTFPHGEVASDSRATEAKTER